MALSEHEQRVLDELEKQLRVEDPHLSSRFALDPRPRTSRLPRLIGGLAAVVAGLILLIFAVSIPAVWLGVLAFVLMLAGGVFALSSSDASSAKGRATFGPGADPRLDHPSFGSKPRSNNASRSFMKKVEDRWDRRSDDFR